MINENAQTSRLDRAFALFLAEKSKLPVADRQPFIDIVTELSTQQNQGHNCIPLDPKQINIIQASGLVSEDQLNPLVLDQERLYLHRYWSYEMQLAKQIASMAQHSYSINVGEAELDQYFPVIDAKPDQQRLATQKSLQLQLSIITGGPGTGKTTTVVKLLALLQVSNPTPLHIALAAPTGKAAHRLQQSIGSNINTLPCTETIKDLIPEQVTTLHRLLGAKPPSPYFRHDQHNPLPYDLVVVDEASMIDLALMSKLIAALKPECRLILLGDKDQLASVESGAVLADLTAALPSHTQALKKAYRFNNDIKNLAEAINQQKAEHAWQLMQDQSASTQLFNQSLMPYLAKQYSEYLQLIHKGAAFTEIFAAFNRFQVLTANRQGPNSLTEINLALEQHLAASDQIYLFGPWYVGRPVMITQNNANLHLYNGDIGICLADPAQTGKIMVFFERPDGSSKAFVPARLPPCETVYAMTIHKSQGSEFEKALIILPEKINPILTRELLYTAVTRAKQQVHVLTSEAVFKQTISQQVSRYGGLEDKLKELMDG